MIETPRRPSLSLERGWTFVPGRVDRAWLCGRSAAGETVDLPHTWNERDTFQYGRRSRVGRGAYRRRFEIPEQPGAAGGGWRLETGGFYGPVRVWLDGRPVARDDGQFLGISVDLGPDLAPGKHLLALELDNLRRRSMLPGGSRVPDFLLHGGLTCAVRLEKVPRLRLDLGSISIRCRAAGGSQARITMSASVASGTPEPGRAELAWRVIAPGAGRPLDTAVCFALAPGSSTPAPVADALVPDPRWWSPVHPDLYWVEARLTVGEEVVDLARVRIGLVDGELLPGRGLFLNGSRVELHGCNRHESIPGLGRALPPELHRRDAETLKRLGCNFVRLSHYPQNPAFLDACDELGILVDAEIATWKSVSGWPGWRRAARRQMRAMILRDRHHPCVALWGMGNESRSRKAYLELGAIVRELDPDRATTYAENHLHRAQRRRTVGLPDVWGTNYELDLLERAAASSRLGVVVASECCNHPRSVKGDEREELEQVAILERDWEAMADLPCVAGYAVWCFADYATEYRDRFRRLAGLHDAWRRPKMAAELFRARHAKEPFVALFVTAPDRPRPRSRFRLDTPPAATPDLAAQLHVFTNCDRLRIVCDGTDVRELAALPHVVLALPGGAGEIVAEAVLGGRPASARWRRHGPAAAIRVTAERGRLGFGETVAIEIEVVDELGEPVRDWHGAVRLGCTGPARVRAFTAADEAELARGEGRTYLTTAWQPGEVVVTASADDLMPARVTLQVGS